MMSFNNPDESIPVLIFRLIIGPISIIGNSIILYIAIRFDKFRSSIANCLISLLAFGELLAGIGIIIRAFYTLYIASIHHLTIYPRFTCLVIALPQIFGLIFTQIILLFMALDRLLAVSKPITYRSSSMLRVYLTIFFALLGGSSFVFLAMWKLDNSPAKQCSTGAAATQAFTKAWAAFGVIIAIFIFVIYITTVVFLIRRSRITDQTILASMQRQKKVFISISLILLSYVIFWCLPLFSLIIIETTTNNDPILIGYISLIIALSSGINSCVGIFIYLAKHQELREYFFKLFPKVAKIKRTKGVQVGATPPQLISTFNKDSRRLSQAIVN